MKNLLLLIFLFSAAHAWASADFTASVKTLDESAGGFKYDPLKIEAPSITPQKAQAYSVIPSFNYNVACGQTYNHNSANFTNRVSEYAGSPSPFNGPDVTYRLNLGTAVILKVKLSNKTGGQRLFLMSRLNSATCIAVGTDSITMAIEQGDYYINVDSPFSSQAGTYTISFNCECLATPTLAPSTNCLGKLQEAQMRNQQIYKYALSPNSVHCSDTVNPNYVLQPVQTVRYGEIVNFKFMNGFQAITRAWIDWNRDNDFNDDGELVANWPTSSYTSGGDIYFPANHPTNKGQLTPNLYRIRFVYTEDEWVAGTATSCQYIGVGGTFDLWINLQPPYFNVELPDRSNLCQGKTYTINYSAEVNMLPPNTTYSAYYRNGAGQKIQLATNTTATQITWAIPYSSQIDGPGTNDSLVIKPDNFPVYQWGSSGVGIRPVPTLTSTTPAYKCGPGSVTLTAATSTDSALWYAPGSSSTVVGNGLSFTTPNLSSSQTYTVRAVDAVGCLSQNAAQVQANVNVVQTVTGFTPASGPVGTPITVTGSWPVGIDNAYVNNTLITARHPLASNQFSAIVPAAATTGKIKVSMAGCADAVSAASFTVTPTAVTDNAFRWVRQAWGAGTQRFNRVRVTHDRSVYAAGAFSGTTSFEGHQGGASLPYTSSGGTDGVLCRYSRSGVLAWVARFASTGDDEALGLAVDRFGYAYVSGYFTGTLSIRTASPVVTNLSSAGGSDGFVAKIHPNGNLVYAFRFGNSGNDRAEGIDVAPDLRFYVAGSFVGNTTVTGISGTAVNLTSRGNSDAFLAKFSDIGTMYWTIQAGGPGNDFGYGAAADITGGGYLMGSYEGTATFNSSLGGTTPLSRTVVGGSDGFVLGVSITGQLGWVASMGGSTNENVRDVAPDPRGTGLVAVGGFSQTATFGSLGNQTATGFYDAFAVRLSNSGAFEWVKKVGGFGQDQAWAVRLDRQGQPIVGMSFAQQATLPGGTTAQSWAGLDGLLVKLSADGSAPLYRAQIAGGSGDEQVRGVDTADGGGAYLAGISAGLATAGTFTLRPTSDPLPDAYLARYANGTALREGMEDEDNLTTSLATSAGLRVLPNPSSQGTSLTLQADGLQGTCRLTAVATDGKPALTLNLSADELTQGTTLHPTLPPGLYTLLLTDGKGQTRSTRLVVR